jgi:hypothetical protein
MASTTESASGRWAPLLCLAGLWACSPGAIGLDGGTEHGLEESGGPQLDAGDEADTGAG